MAKYFASEAALENFHRGHAHPRRLRLFQGIRHRAPLSRRAADLHRRRHQRDAAHHHFQAMDQEEPRRMKPLQGVRIVSVRAVRRRALRAPCCSPTSAPRSSRSRTPRSAAIRRARPAPSCWAPNDSQYYQTFNINKKSVALDLQTAEGSAGFERLVATADAVINNLRGDQPAKLGLDYASAVGGQSEDRLRAPLGLRPRQRARVVAGLRLSDAGRGRPDAPDRRAGRPARRASGASIVDYMTGMTAAVGLLACILRAQRSGKGCDVDTCLFDVALHQLGYVGDLVSERGPRLDAPAPQRASIRWRRCRPFRPRTAGSSSCA